MKLWIAVVFILAVMGLGFGAWIALIVLEGWKTALAIFVIVWCQNIHMAREIKKATE